MVEFLCADVIIAVNEKQKSKLSVKGCVDSG